MKFSFFKSFSLKKPKKSSKSDASDSLKANFIKHLDPMMLILSYYELVDVYKMQILNKWFYNKIIPRSVGFQNCPTYSGLKFYDFKDNALWRCDISKTVLDKPGCWNKVELGLKNLYNNTKVLMV